MTCLTHINISKEANKLVTTLFPRQIRSFSCRETRLGFYLQHIFETAWPQYGISLSPDQTLNFDELFGRSASRTLEIGFGDGASLLSMAKNYPEKDFIAIEVFRKGIASLLAGIIKHSLNNIRIIFKDAVEVVNHHIPDNSLQTIQIFFAYPWPKTRHHKRRLIQTEFIQLLTQKLVVGGVIHCATDWEHYARHMISVLSENPKLRNNAGEKIFLERPDFRPKTKYEKRAEKESRSVFDLMFERI